MQVQKIQTKIHLIRDQRVMLDFPEDFMFQLTEKEWQTMSSQFVMTFSKRPKSSMPFAFTEQGLATKKK